MLWSGQLSRQKRFSTKLPPGWLVPRKSVNIMHRGDVGSVQKLLNIVREVLDIEYLQKAKY